MINTDATTPQLTALKGLADALASGQTAELPDLTKEAYLQKFGAAFGIFANIELKFHDVIEAQGKVVTHHSFLFTNFDGKTLEYDAVAIVTFVDEDGKLKFLDCKEFTDPEKRSALHAEAAKVLEKGMFAA